MTIDVEIRFVAVHALADVVGHPAYGENICGAVESEGVVGIQSLTSPNFGVNRREARVVGLKGMVLARGRHPHDDIAGTSRSHKKAALALGDDPVADFVVLRVREHVARYQFMSIAEGAVGDDAIGLTFGHPR